MRLLCVTGLSPQVVTETLYALVCPSDPAVAPQVPKEIHVITTLEGRKRIHLNLFETAELGGRGQFRQFCDDYGLDRNAIRFDDSTIHVITDAEGHELPDIADHAQNEAAADSIIELVRRLTEDSSELHVSLAGGRKTMGFLAGYALSLYGRPQDRLSHVLVNRPFENLAEFYYPPPKPRTLKLPGRNESASTAEARISLAEIPFVRLRGGLDPELLKGKRRYMEVVRNAQAAVETPCLVLDFLRDKFRAHDIPLKLSGNHRLWAYWMARRVLNGQGPVAFDEAGAKDLVQAAEELEGQAPDNVIAAWRSVVHENEINYFERTLSRFNKTLHKALGPTLARRYEIAALQGRPKSMYGFKLAPEHIQVVK